jgi:hypothetical protein
VAYSHLFLAIGSTSEGPSHMQSHRQPPPALACWCGWAGHRRALSLATAAGYGGCKPALAITDQRRVCSIRRCEAEDASLYVSAGFAADPDVAPAAKQGRPSADTKVAIRHLNKLSSDSAERIVARLKRDAPEIAEGNAAFFER